MTKEELYDLARKRYEDPAVFTLGGRCILGYWVKRNVHAPAPPEMTFTCNSQGIIEVAKGTTWWDVALAAGLVSLEECAAIISGTDARDGTTLVSGTMTVEERKELEKP